LLLADSVKTRDVVIRTPCGADWKAMDPRGPARFCADCKKLVHDLSALSELEARALLSGTSESLCVRYLHDASGEIWFEGGQKLVPVPRLTRGRRGLAAVALAAAPVLFQACGGADAYGSDPYDAGSDAAAEGAADDSQADAATNAPTELAVSPPPDAGGGEGGQPGEND
jgi:hypothetical protein